MPNKGRVLVTGATGFLGHHLSQGLLEHGAEVIPASRRHGVDLTVESSAFAAILSSRPDVIIHVAGPSDPEVKELPGTLFRDTMRMGMNVIEAAHYAQTRLIFVGSPLSYPEKAETPLREESFWNGFPAAEDVPVGVAKRALHVMCQAYRAQFGLRYVYLVPCALYGPGDHFGGDRIGTIPALMRNFVQAVRTGTKEVTCPGSGQETVPYLYVADAAQAILHAAWNLEYKEEVLNLQGAEISMKELVWKIGNLVGFTGQVKWDASTNGWKGARAVDGRAGGELLKWKPSTSLDKGLKDTAEWYVRAFLQEAPK